ncbi:InlB B-repeat-containing protein [Paenibacillus sp. WQ 127069]|uniref:InlB B-repeat-containing protein n=1 Tax=Paenibacillus baimaensis TaxID=2982185 RepID=A0ABT2UC20_9BACL|nr:InlB B-repeat-containing protein [Paenibacillus sp. WQ 127069]MCU6791576.1 InlB B-repeat-containing protein [Paenibacillus sp. WQ 127069]
MKFKIRTTMRFICLLLLAVLVYFPVASGTAEAVATGVTDGTYDFGGTLAAYDGTYKKSGDKFLVSKDLVKSGTSLWPQTQVDGNNPGYMELTAEGTSTLGSFTFQDLGFSTTVSKGLSFNLFHITFYDSKGNMTFMNNYGSGGNWSNIGTGTVKLSSLFNSNKLFQKNDVRRITILWIFSDNSDPSRFKLDNISIANVQKGKFSVDFNSNGGSAVSSQNVAFNEKATAPANPSRTGYTFGGWYTDEGLTKAFSFGTAITVNTTLYAKWTLINYTVAFNSNGGTAVSSQSVGYDGIPNKPADPTRTGYTFGGWYTDAGLTTAYAFNTAITGNTTLYAKWTLNNYTVTFNSNGGTAVVSQTVSYNSKATTPTAPTRTGYTFGGWYKDVGLTTAYAFTTAITGNTTLYAKWTLNNYTVTFNSNGGTAVGSQTIGYNNTATTPTAPTRTGYTFGGWYKDSGLTTAYSFTTAITGNITLYAKWTLNNYTVTFNSNSGTAVNSQTVGYNNTATTPTPTTRTGYTFGGWYKDSGLTTAFTFTTAITGNTTLYAKWTVNNYTVTFNSNSGTAVSSQTVGYNSMATTPTAPTRTGYSFGGWYKDTGLTTAFAFTTAITGNTTLYAKWTPNNYTVTFNSNGGTAVSSQTIGYNNTATAPTAPTKTGYTFGGWYKDAGLTTAFAFTTAITGNTTLYAKWTLNNYTVTFSSNGGTAVSSQTIGYNNTATTPTAPTRTGYTFGGWYTDTGLTTPFVFTTMITGNTTLYAKWVLNYTVTFSSNGGTAVSSQTINQNSTATAPANPTKTGYTFGGWYSDVGLTTPFVFTTAITGNRTLYAKWTANSITVIFNSNGGTTVSNLPVSYNSTATAPADPVKTGYTFGGWYADELLTTPFLFTAVITEDTTLYAGWATNSYAVTFNSNGGSSVSSLAVSYNSIATAPANPTKAGHTFEGWYTDAGLTTAFAFTTAITGDMALFANWTTASYTVTFDSNGGTAVGSLAVSYNGTATAPANPAKADHTFEDWYTDAGLTTPFVFTTAITGDMTLYAKWTMDSYIVTFDSNGGTSVSSQAVSYNTTTTAPPSPTKAGHTFEGWYTDAGLMTPFVFTTAITGDMVLYAHWTTDSYTVTFDSNDGTAVGSLTVSYNSTAAVPANPTKAGHTFEGWYTDTGLTTVFTFTTAITGNVVLYANWTTDSYTVTFDSNEGSAVNSLEVSYNSTVTAPADPVKTGYTFGGWYADELLTTPFVFTTTITEDKTLYAGWATNSYAVTFNSNGGSSVGSLAVSYNSTATAPADPIMTGNTFAGWYTDAGLTTAFSFNTVIAGNTTLYAKWTADSYAVSFDSNGGTEVSSLAISYNSTVTAPADPEKPGYTFGGWYTDAGLTTVFTFTTVITENTTLYAKWATGSYGVTFNSNGGTSVGSLAVSYNSTTTAPADPTKAGHTFEGWYTDAGLTTAFTFTTAITGNTVLYANWTTDSYDVTFDSNEGSAVSSRAVSYNSTTTAPADPTKAGYTFAGWYANAGLTSPFLFTTAITADTTLYAKWATNSYTVTFISNGGTIISGQAVSYNSTAAAPADPTKSGHTFEGWYTDAGLTKPFTFAAIITENTTLHAKWTTSSSADLSNLIVSDTLLSPIFAANKMNYTANVINGIRSVTVTAWVYESHSVIKVNNVAVTSGQATEAVNLNEGNNTIIVDVTAQDGTTKAYSVTIIRAPEAPVGLAVVASDGMATLNWKSVQGSVSYNVYGGTASRSYGAAPIGTVTGATYSYVASGLTNGTSYYFTVMANSTGGNSLYSNEVIAMPLSGDTSLKSLNLTGVTLSPTFEPGVFSYTTIVPSSVAAVTVTAAVYEKNATAKITVNGIEIMDDQVTLNMGRNIIGIVVTAQNGVTNTYVVTVDRLFPKSGSSSAESNQVKPQEQNEIQLMIDDKSYSQIVSTSMTGDQNLTITIDAAQMKDLLEKTEIISVVSMLISSKVDNISVLLPGDIVKAMESKHAVWEVRTPNGNYSLPASEIGIDRLAAQFGTDTLKDIIVQVSIGKKPFNWDKWNANGAGNRHYTFVGQPVDFQITATYKGNTEKVSKFFSYIKREIPLPDGTELNEVTTAVVLNEDGTLHHVPTYLRSKDGKHFAIIHSLTNSVYALIHNQMTFADVDKHWSKNEVNDLASRVIVNGANETQYDPNKAVTRAEFAAIIVRALGLSDTGGTAAFTDVQSGDWYAGAVSMAQEYSIINGYEDGTFRPANTITREEAMALVMRAMKLTGLETAMSTTDIVETLSMFSRSESVSVWAKPAVASAVRNGIVNGTDAGLMPGSDITRAETAAIVQRMLRKAKLID